MAQLFLIGYMGVGKSTIGRLLAERLQHPFIDLDSRIIEATGTDIPNFFAQHGEEAFRRKETEILKRSDEEGAVVACGGGTPCSDENLRILKERGTLIHLKASAAFLSTRLKGAEEGRPKLKGTDERSIDAQLRERMPFYEKADLTVNVEGKTPETCGEEILAFLHSK